MDISELIDLQVACLAGGFVIQVDDARTVRQAQALGAVGALLLPNPSGDLRATVRAIARVLTIHPVLSVGAGSAWESLCREELGHTAPQAFLLGQPEAKRGRHYWPTLLSKADLETVLTHETSLAVVDPALLPEVNRIRLDRHLTCLIFGLASDIGQARRAVAASVDGLLLGFLPTSDQVETLARALLSGQPALEKHLGRRLLGVLALQGDYHLQAEVLRRALKQTAHPLAAQIEVGLVRSVADAEACDALIMPGGWSNLQTHLLDLTGLADHLVSRRRTGTPILAICAGMVLAASRPGQHCEDRRLLGLIDLAVDNNQMSGLRRLQTGSGDTCELLFSNAPTARDLAVDVEVLGTSEGGEIVAARQDRVFVAAYHKGGDIHRRFIDHCLNYWGAF